MASRFDQPFDEDDVIVGVEESRQPGTGGTAEALRDAARHLVAEAHKDGYALIVGVLLLGISE